MSAAYRVPTWALLFAVLALAAIASESAAAPPAFDSDGWHTWQVRSDDGMLRCCGIGTRGKLTAGGCDLDSGHHMRTCTELVTTDSVRIYARSESGSVTDIRVLSPGCPVESRYEIHDLGVIDNADSVAWLRPYLRSELGEKAIAAIAAHSGPDAFAALRSLFEDRAVDRELREQVLFWLVQSHSDERFAYVETLITGR